MPRVQLYLPLLLLLTLGNCTNHESPESPEPPDDPPTVAAITPAIAALPPSTSLDFVAVDGDGGTVEGAWSVNGVLGGDDSLGRVTPAGRYTAPANLPGIDSVVLTAGQDAGTASATLFFLPSGPTADYRTSIPRVVDATTDRINHVLVVPGSGVASIRFIPTTGGETTLPRIGGGAFLLDLPTSQATVGYVPGSLHNTIGSLQYRAANGTVLRQTNFSVNIRDAGMALVPVTRLAPDAQRTPHLINLRVDHAAGATAEQATIARAIQLLGDRFEQFVVIPNVDRNANRHHQIIRNGVTGIGAPTIDLGAAYGSPARLQGVNYFPLSPYFDASDIALAHEIGHQWINHASASAFAEGVPHWPPSSLANGVMGFSIGGPGGQGGRFPFRLDSLGGGLYQVRPAPYSNLYGPWELYLMGLLPADSVPTALILPANYTDAPTPVTHYTVAQFIADVGPRVPAFGAAPTDFNVATLVLSYGRLLSPSEMAFFDANAARGEATSPLPYSIGFGQGMSSPFFVATGGRARLHMEVE